jgi:sarcosine oxidase subunit beta
VDERTFDAIIIGAGIMGLSSAFQLSQRGLRVLVLDKSSLGAGGTGQSSAIIRQHYSNQVTARMALESLRVFQNFKEIVGGESGFKQTGFLVLTPAEDVDGLRANVALQRSVGIATEELDSEAILEIFPALEASHIVAAYEPDSGYADPNLVLNSYSAAARRNGAKILQDTAVTGISMSGGKVQEVATSGGKFSSAIVVNCAGAWGGRVAALTGLGIPVSSCRVQVAFFRRPEGHETSHPVIADFVHGVYWRAESGGLTLVGLIDPSEEHAVVDPDRFRQSLDADFVEDAGERLVRRFPAMERSQSTGGYASLYAITPDWHPIIDEAIPGSGFYLCTGFSGHGFKLGPAVGRMTADMVLGEETPDLDRGLFRLSRYAEGKPVRGAYEYSIVASLSSTGATSLFCTRSRKAVPAVTCPKDAAPEQF